VSGTTIPEKKSETVTASRMIPRWSISQNAAVL